MKRSGVAAADPELLLSELLLPVYDRAQEASVLNDAAGLVATLAWRRRFRRLWRARCRRRPVPRTAAISAGCARRRSRPSCARRSRRSRSARSPTRSSARPACISSRYATGGPAPQPAAPRPRADPPHRRAGAARTAGQPLSARPAPGRLCRRPDLIGRCPLPIGAGRCPSPAASCAASASPPTSGWASISCSTRRSCAGSPRRRRPRDGATVLEVGPGPGGLTRALLEAGASASIAVERDARFVPRSARARAARRRPAAA